jgi:hypothetical protein
MKEKTFYLKVYGIFHAQAMPPQGRTDTVPAGFPDVPFFPATAGDAFRAFAGERG